MTDLDKLIAAVRAGVWDNGLAWRVFGIGKTGQAERAYNGSLDAALRLHEALLPGWEWLTRKNGWCSLHSPDFESLTWEAGDRVATDILSGTAICVGTIPDPARAFLLAILRALKSKGEA